MISLITAIDSAGGIGKDGKIPWHCSEDLKFFKCMTQKKLCLAGKSTYDNLPSCAKEDRVWIRFTKNPVDTDEVTVDSEWFKRFTVNVDEKYAPNIFNSIEMMLCGGAKIYKEFLDRDWVDRLYITRISGNYNCDTLFPKYDESKFKFSYRIFLNTKPFEEHLYVDVYDRK